MTDAELRKLKRPELLEILLEQAKEIERLEKENAELKHELEDKRIRIANVGTMAQAAFSLNGVFEAADAAVSQYMKNIRAMEAELKAKLEERTEGEPETGGADGDEPEAGRADGDEPEAGGAVESEPVTE